GIDDPRPASPLHEHRAAAYCVPGAHRAVHATGNDLLRLGEELGGGLLHGEGTSHRGGGRSSRRPPTKSLADDRTHRLYAPVFHTRPVTTLRRIRRHSSSASTRQCRRFLEGPEPVGQPATEAEVSRL